MLGLVISIMAICAISTSALTMDEFLFEGVDLPEELSRTHELAVKERDRVEELKSNQANNLVAIVPNNEAWEHDADILDTLLDDNVAASLRYDLLLAGSADIAGATDWKSLVRAAAANNGVLDTAYGTSYFLYDDGTVCIALWDDNDARYVPGDCAHVDPQSYELDDAHVYMVDKVLLPDVLREEIEAAAV